MRLLRFAPRAVLCVLLVLVILLPTGCTQNENPTEWIVALTIPSGLHVGQTGWAIVKVTDSGRPSPGVPVEFQAYPTSVLVLASREAVINDEGKASVQVGAVGVGRGWVEATSNRFGRQEGPIDVTPAL